MLAEHQLSFSGVVHHQSQIPQSFHIRAVGSHALAHGYWTFLQLIQQRDCISWYRQGLHEGWSNLFHFFLRIYFLAGRKHSQLSFFPQGQTLEARQGLSLAELGELLGVLTFRIVPI